MLDHVHQCLLVVVLFPRQNAQQKPVIGPVLLRQLKVLPVFQVLDEGLHLDLLVLVELLGHRIDQPLLCAFLGIADKEILIHMLHSKHLTGQKALAVKFVERWEALPSGLLGHSVDFDLGAASFLLSRELVKVDTINESGDSL